MSHKILCVLPLFILTSTQGVSQSGRISQAGYQVKIEAMPWTVRLVTWRSMCTGAIVSKSWVLTAAHCTHSMKSASDMKVYSGSNVKNGPDEQKRTANKFVIHPSYWANRFSKYDLALIRVEPDFVFSDKVKPLELDGGWPITDGPKNPRKCLAGGWGTQEIGGPSTNSLRAVNVTALHGDKGCSCALRFQNKRLVCLEERGAGVCTGDSGSALVCNGKGVAIAHMLYLQTQCKIFSFGSSQLDCSDGDAVSAFIFICPELNWIREYVSEAPPKPASCKASALTRISDGLTAVISIIHFFLSA